MGQNGWFWTSIVINAIGFAVNLTALIFYSRKLLQKDRKLAIYLQLSVHLLCVALATSATLVTIFIDVGYYHQIANIMQFLYFIFNIWYYQLLARALVFLYRVNPGPLARYLSLFKIINTRTISVFAALKTLVIVACNWSMLLWRPDIPKGHWISNVNNTNLVVFLIWTLAWCNLFLYFNLLGSD
jgi:hypothetical protein